MPGLSGLALTTEQVIEVISLYSTPPLPLLGVEDEPGWYVAGSIWMPVSADVVLDMIGIISDPSLVMTTQLYCLEPGFIGEVAGSRVQLASAPIDTRALSSQFTLTGQRMYQVRAQLVGNAGAGYFGTLRRATLQNTL